MEEKSERMLNSINWTPSKSQTHIIQSDVELEQRLAGFCMNKCFTDFVLPYRNNFQKYLCEDVRFQGYVQLSLENTSLEYFQKLMMDSKVLEVDDLCQSIILLLYDILCQSCAKTASIPEFELYSLKMSQIRQQCNRKDI